MYTRVNDRKTGEGKIKIPDNYGGNAFRDQNYYFPKADTPPEDYKKAPENPPDIAPKEIVERQNSEEKAEITSAILPTEKVKSDTLLSSLFPSKSLKNHFPFGHGIGSEEILILGIMSLIFFSDDKEPDGELIMLLALLLFAG